MIKNDDIFSNIENNYRQKNAEKRRIRQEYLARAETAADNAARLILNGQKNGIEHMDIGEEYKGPIMRYYRKYWLRYMHISLIFISILIFIISFYTLQATYLIFVAFLVILISSEDVYMVKLVGFGTYSSQELEVIKAKLFSSRYDIKRNFGLMVGFTVISIIAHTFTFSILNYATAGWIFFQNYAFNSQNELYAIINVILILSMSFLRFLRKI